MFKFNPEKELKKLQRGSRNKIILFVISLLAVGVISYSFALYQVRCSKRIIYTKVAPFSNHDIELAVYINDNLTSDFPTENQEYVYDKIVCDNNTDNHIKAYWDYDIWALVLKTSKKARCNVYFRTGTDRSGANPPELYQGLIPVTIADDGDIKVADTKTEWYNYDAHEWANAILIDDKTNHDKYYNEDGTYKKDTVIPIEDVLQMYVWIPRYRYKLFNAISGQNSNPQIIEIEFEHGTVSTGEVSCTISSTGVETCTRVLNGNWYTHPAFTFGDTELPGIWVGKFETSHTTKSLGNSSTDVNAILNCSDNTCDEANYIRILPNKSSLRYNNLSNFFYVTQSLTQKNNLFNLNGDIVDTHVIKNIEWGAVTYLSQSKYGRCFNQNCTSDVAYNINANFYTGYAGTDKVWNTDDGVKASTTGNMYGVYDLSGNWEYVMGNMVNSEGNFYPSSSGFTTINKRYYDIYSYSTSITSHNRGHLGDATRETLITYGNNSGGTWYKGDAALPAGSECWFRRGGKGNVIYSIYSFAREDGMEQYDHSFHIVLTAQDNTK